MQSSPTFASVKFGLPATRRCGWGNDVTEPFATIPGRYDDLTRRSAIDEAIGRRRRSTRIANLGVFTGYRIGFDIGNGNIGWCVLFERGAVPYFLTAETIAAHNAALSPGEPRTQLPDLDMFVPLGTHKFEARNSDGKSLSKVRAEARAKRRSLDARQSRRWKLRSLLEAVGLYPRKGEEVGGLKDGHGRPLKADILRVKLLEPGSATHPHDLGRALYNALKRRGWMKPVGRAGVREDSAFGSGATAKYREALAKFGCRTIGEFLQRCQADALQCEQHRIRKRHRPLAWQQRHGKEQPKADQDAKSYEVFPFLSPTFDLIWEEAERLREAQAKSAPVDDALWQQIKERASFRRLLRPSRPGRCEFLPDEWRCVRALPSYQEFRILQQVDNLRRPGGKRLAPDKLDAAADVLRHVERISVPALGKKIGVERLGLDEKEEARTLSGAKTDIGLSTILGERWKALSSAERDRWVLRFLSRHPTPLDATEPKQWDGADDAKLESDCAKMFGPEGLGKIRQAAGKLFDDKFANISARAAAILAEGYRSRLDHDQRLDLLAKEGGAPPTVMKLFERLPYYGEVMTDITVDAERFAPRERTAAEELAHGRAANPDVHVVMNRLRKVTNAIIDMMGGILPTSCTIEVAREALSEEAADKRASQMKARAALRETIVEKITRALGEKPLPIGPSLDRLVDRWIAAARQGWRDYDGSDIPPSQLCDSAIYQLDHVSPAAFGEFQQGNLFVSRLNQQKGRRLPWDAFPEHRGALLAFSQFGLESQIGGLNFVLKRAKSTRDTARIRLRIEALEKRLSEIEQTAPGARPDVLQRLRRTQTSEVERLLEPDGGDGEFKHGRVTAFRPGEQSSLFKKLGPDMKLPEGDFAARDVANIGWSSKLALRYLAHLGPTIVSVKPWAVHALRCLFGINKDRTDLRNHAVDAFLIAHFDSRVIVPAFLQLRGQHYEDLYDSRFLDLALGTIAGSAGVFEGLKRDLQQLNSVLCHIATSHRPDNKWNPGDPAGGSLGSFGGENIYSFRPDSAERTKLSSLVWKARKTSGDTMTKATLLELMERDPSRVNDPQERKLTQVLRSEATLRYSQRGAEVAKSATSKREISSAVRHNQNTFINIEAKFAIVAPTSSLGREVIAVADFSALDAAERTALFSRSRLVLRPGDTVLFSSSFWIVTALRRDGRVTLFPVDVALRDSKLQKRPTIPAKVAQKIDIERIAFDVLGQRLHRRRKSGGDIQPVSYRLFG